jgi:hypothetical protein
MTRRFDPFESAREFHDYLRKGTQVWSGDSADLLKLTSLHTQDWGAPTFTHGDLSSLNILVRGDDVVGIIDWETAGWYPPYWEYTAACQVNPQKSFWRDEIDKFLEPIPDAFEMEQLRQQYLGGSFWETPSLLNRFSPLDQVESWHPRGVKTALAVKSRLIFLALTIWHSCVANGVPLDYARTYDIRRVFKFWERFFDPANTVPALLTLSDGDLSQYLGKLVSAFNLGYQNSNHDHSRRQHGSGRFLKLPLGVSILLHTLTGVISDTFVFWLITLGFHQIS